MLKVSIWKIREEKVERLSNWLRELNSRKDEVRQTFVAESTRHEQAYIVGVGDTHMLVYAMEAGDFGRAAEAYSESTYRIDAEHRDVMKECLEVRLEQPPIYDVEL